MNLFEWRHHFGFVNMFSYYIRMHSIWYREWARVFSTCIHRKCQLNVYMKMKTHTRTRCLLTFKNDNMHETEFGLSRCVYTEYIHVCIDVHLSCNHLSYILLHTHTSSSCCLHIFPVHALAGVLRITNAERISDGRTVRTSSDVWAQTHRLNVKWFV